MKKLIIFIFLCIIATLWITEKNHRDNRSPLLLNNIEAIAGDELGHTGSCMFSGTVDCPWMNIKVEYYAAGMSLEVQY